MDIGHKVKELRIRNGLTLEELAERSELTKGFLSQLERNLTSPSIATLEDILSALGSNLSEFFSTAENNEVVFRKDDYYVSERDGVTTSFIVPNAQKNSMEPIILCIESGRTSRIMEPHAGEEFGYVLSGKIELVNGLRKYKLKKGETFYLLGRHEHYLVNNSNATATVIWVVSPPNF